MPDINFDDSGTPLSAPKIMALRDSSHAYHKLADIGRKAVAGRVEFIAVHAEKPGFLVGSFCEGYGFFNVHFPREACGELTAEEKAWLSGQRAVISPWPVVDKQNIKAPGASGCRPHEQD